MKPASFKRPDIPSANIRHALWLYARFRHSYREIEEMLAESPVDVPH